MVDILMLKGKMPSMNLYWLSRDGGAPEGPFAEEQLLAMWRNGTITAAAAVAADGEEGWTPVVELIEIMEGPQREAAAEQQRRDRRAAAMRANHERYEREKKSVPMAVILGLLIPGLGTMYAGYTGLGLAYLLTLGVGLVVLAVGAVELGMLLVGLGLLMWLLSPFSAGLAAQKTNTKLKQELGLM